MITKPLVIALVLCMTVQTVMSQEWQSAEMVDTIRHTEDSIWIPDRRAPVAPAPQVRQHTAEPSFVEQSASAQVVMKSGTSMAAQALQDLNMVEALKAEIKATLTNQLQAEINARVERERAETRLLEKVAKRVASWTPNFRFKATDSPSDSSSSTSSAPAATTSTTPTGSVVVTPPLPNKCNGVECQNGGTCVEGKCTCQTGFSGARCEVKAQCDAASCLNGGKCMNNVCVCAPGWMGPICATPDPNKCNGVNCLNGGECQKETGACMCFGNFKGKTCEIAPPAGQECTNVDCKNGGTCKAPGFCHCTTGFSGKYCEKDACTGVQCQNGGQCKQGQCVCAGGWSGQFCTVDPCKNTTCHNSGTCVAGTCKCTPEWEGPTCTVSMKTPAPFDVKPIFLPPYDACSCPGAAPVNCSLLNNSMCPNSTIKANVTRMNSTISMANVSPLYPCHSVPCQNGGVCLEGKCKCFGKWSGLLCETDLCATVTCQNGGICYNGKCQCHAQFGGLYCEKDACEGVTCENGGFCRWGKCQCLPDFEGKRCQRRSALGNRRDEISRRLTGLTKRLERVDLRLPRTQNITSPELVRDLAANATKKVISDVGKAMQDIVDAASNRHAQPPRMKKDIRGRYRWHQQTPPAVIKQRIKAVPLPKRPLEIRARHLNRAAELNTNATADHNEFPKVMKQLEDMAFTEGGAEAEAEVEAEADAEYDDHRSHAEMEADAEREERELDDRAHAEVMDAESDAAFFF